MKAISIRHANRIRKLVDFKLCLLKQPLLIPVEYFVT